MARPAAPSAVATSVASNSLRPPATTAGARRRQAPLVGPRLRRFGAERLIEQLEAARDRVGAVGGFDRARIGEIGPGDLAVGAARPGGARDRVEQRAQRAERGVGLGVAVAQPRELQPLAGNVEDAHHGAAGDGAAVDLEMAALEARGGERERFAAAEQPLDRLLQIRGERRARATRRTPARGAARARRRRARSRLRSRGSPSGRSQASRICGSLARNRLARSSAARVRASSLASSASRWVQRRRPTRWSEAVSTEKNSSSRMTRPLMSAANGSSSASGPPPASAGAAPDGARAERRRRAARGAPGERARNRGPPGRLGALADRVVGCKPRPPETFAGAPAAGRRRRRLVLLPPRGTNQRPPDLRKAAEKVVNRMLANFI